MTGFAETLAVLLMMAAPIAGGWFGWKTWESRFDVGLCAGLAFLLAVDFVAASVVVLS